MYSSYSFTTWALDGVEWSASRPGLTLPPGKGPPVPIVQEAGWAPEPVWTQRLEVKVLSPLPGIEPRSPGRPARSETLHWATIFCSILCIWYQWLFIYLYLFMFQTLLASWNILNHSAGTGLVLTLLMPSGNYIYHLLKFSNAATVFVWSSQ
jgi:hypothetical protein